MSINVSGLVSVIASQLDKQIFADDYNKKNGIGLKNTNRNVRRNMLV